jgi:hypothetical protein
MHRSIYLPKRLAQRGQSVIASEAKQSSLKETAESWIASSQGLLAMTNCEKD